jgi:hypothetical protein
VGEDDFSSDGETFLKGIPGTGISSICGLALADDCGDDFLSAEKHFEVSHLFSAAFGVVTVDSGKEQVMELLPLGKITTEDWNLHALQLHSCRSGTCLDWDWNSTT